ncbi:hypothetical protein HDU93_006958 [Gonapodya sp. JEL0774]|nr:hypothetical protein HDU93_006958 [Gonapodya sp. JEL0774]
MSSFAANKNVTLVPIGPRIFRVATASLPSDSTLLPASSKESKEKTMMDSSSGPPIFVEAHSGQGAADKSSKTTVINIKSVQNPLEWMKDPSHAYIGRAMPAGERFPAIPGSDWGNPFKIGPDSPRELVISQYEQYIRERLLKEPSLRDRILALDGKVLACWCRPEACHGDVLVKLVDELKGTDSPTPTHQPANGRSRPTHFLCFPLGTDANLVRRVTTLYSDIRTLKLAGFHESLLIPPARLHLTLAVLSLPTTADIERARKVLRGLSSLVYDALDTRTLMVRIRGLNVMVGTAESAHVVYVGVAEEGFGIQDGGAMEGRAAKVAGMVKQGLVQAGFPDLEAERDLKLHMTIKSERKKAEINQKVHAEQRAAAEKKQKDASPASILTGPGSSLPTGVGRQPFASAKNAEERAEAASSIILAMEEDKEDPLPTDPTEFETYCKNHILQGEMLFRQGPQFNDVSAVAFFKALVVYERPMDLLMILQRSIPEEVLISILDLFKAYTTRESTKRRQAYFKHFPDPAKFPVKVQEKLVDGSLKRSLVALKDFAQGEELFVEEPLIAGLEARYEGTGDYCSLCLKSIDVNANGHVDEGEAEPNEATASGLKIEKNGLVFCSAVCRDKSNELWDQFLTPSSESGVDLEGEPGDADLDPLGFDPVSTRAVFARLLKHNGELNSSHPLIIARFYALLVGERRSQLRKLAEVAAAIDAGGEAPTEDPEEAKKVSVFAHLERMQYIDMEALEKDKDGAAEADAKEIEMITEILGPQLPGLEEVLNEEQYRKMRGKLLYNAYGIHFNPNPTRLPAPAETSTPKSVDVDAVAAAEDTIAEAPAVDTEPAEASPTGVAELAVSAPTTTAETDVSDVTSVVPPASGKHSAVEEDSAPSSASPTKPTKRPIRSAKSLTANPVTATALYLVSSYASHSCNPSAELTHPDETAKCRVVAKRDIKEGEIVSLAWIDVDSVDSTEERRKVLKAGWGFICECERCGKKE